MSREVAIGMPLFEQPSDAIAIAAQHRKQDGAVGHEVTPSVPEFETAAAGSRGKIRQNDSARTFSIARTGFSIACLDSRDAESNATTRQPLFNASRREQPGIATTCDEMTQKKLCVEVESKTRSAPNIASSQPPVRRVQGSRNRTSQGDEADLYADSRSSAQLGQ
jgi:hypothetical protein